MEGKKLKIQQALSGLYLTLLVLGFFSYVLSPTQALANAFKWESTDTITNGTEKFILSPDGESAGGEVGTRYSSEKYYIYLSKTPITISLPQSTPVIAYATLAVEKGDPLKGELNTPNPGNGNAVEAVTIADPKGVAPEPLKIINKGMLIGEVKLPDDLSETNAAFLITKLKLSLKTSAGTVIDVGGVDIRGIEKDNNKYYYAAFSLDQIKNTVGGLYEGDYVIYGTYGEHADCATKEMKNGGADQFLCTMTSTINTNFSLKYLPGGYGKITVKNGTTFETASPANNKSTETMTKATRDKGLNVEVIVTVESPLDQAISNAIKWILGGVSKGLSWTMAQVGGLLDDTENIVIGKKGEATPALYGPWVSLRNMGLSLLVLALVIIAFANVVQVDIDKYGLNRMIPRIIISIIMAYASWIIVIFFFDLSSAIQGQAKGLVGGIDLIKTLQSVTPTIPTSTQIIANISIIFVVIAILIGVWACGIILLFTLLLRIVMLSFLLVIAPLAFILNIMPFSANLYKQWWNEFFKWMFMGPVALAIIALGGVIASSVGFSGTSGQSLLDPNGLSLSSTGARGGALLGLIIFAASLYVAATLPMKWGGSIMKSWSGVGKKIWGATGGNVEKAAKWGAKSTWQGSGIPGGVKQSFGTVGKKLGDNRAKRENYWAQKGPGAFKAGMSEEVFERNLEAARLNEDAKKHEYRTKDAFDAAYGGAKSDHQRRAILLAGARANMLSDDLTDRLVEHSAGNMDTTGLLEEAAQKDFTGDLLKSKDKAVAARAAWNISKTFEKGKEGDITKIGAMMAAGNFDGTAEGSKIAGKFAGITDAQLRKQAENHEDAWLNSVANARSAASSKLPQYTTEAMISKAERTREEYKNMPMGEVYEEAVAEDSSRTRDIENKENRELEFARKQDETRKAQILERDRKEAETIRSVADSAMNDGEKPTKETYDWAENKIKNKDL